MTVWKFVLAVTDEQEVAMPIGAEVMYVGYQGGDLCVWAWLDPSWQHALRKFYVVGTGRPIPADAVYRGSVLAAPFVWHVFEDDA